MIEKFTRICRGSRSELLDQNHTSESMLLMPRCIPKSAPGPRIEIKRTSESGR